MTDDYLDTILPHWRNPPQRGTVVPSRAMIPHVKVIDGWQAICAACEELPWAVGPWRATWIDAALDAWVHNDRHPEPPNPTLTWDEMTAERDEPCPPSLLPNSLRSMSHASSEPPAST
jgi:hypothetical protein